MSSQPSTDPNGDTAAHSNFKTDTTPRTNTRTRTDKKMDTECQQFQLSAQEQDLKTQAQVEAISQEIKATQNLTSEIIPISKLSNPFEPGTDFREGCDYLASKYKSYRAIRGDGNCYYRAFLYALCETLYNDNSNSNGNSVDNTDTSRAELKRIQEFVDQSIEQVVQCGYDRFTIETFHEEMVDLLAAIVIAKDKDKDKEESSKESSEPSESSFSKIHEMLNEENSTSDYCVWYLRVIASAYLKADPDRFIHFLDDPNYTDVASYCAREIDPMGRECAMVGVLALAEAFGVCVEIEYMDGKELVNGKLVKHSFGGDDEDSALCITLLYRPGHYDILYK
jgi:ubiquitin thioesterase protein OTUB1